MSMARWLYEYDRHGNLVGRIFLNGRKPLEKLTENTATWPKYTWFQQRRGQVLIKEGKELV